MRDSRRIAVSSVQDGVFGQWDFWFSFFFGKRHTHPERMKRFCPRFNVAEPVLKSIEGVEVEDEEGVVDFPV
jgi:hypothetical protein